MAYIDDTELEVRARRIAAKKMGLSDPSGMKLPDDLWQQCWADAMTEALKDRYELRR